MTHSALAHPDIVPPSDALEMSMTLAMALNKLPPLSPLVPKVLALKRDSDAGITELANVMSSDPMLCARLIGMANSVHFSAGRPLMSIQDALMRLGFIAACDLAVSVAVSRSLPAALEFRPARRDLWLHSLGVALCARELARRADGDCDPDAAYLAGFLHDIGYLAIIALWPDTARKLLVHLTTPELGTEPHYERHYDSPTHGAIGGELCKLWRLPDDIWVTVWDHDGLAEDGKSVQMLDAVIALAHRAVDGVLPLKHEIIWRPAVPLSVLLERTGLAPKALDDVRSMLERQAERLAGAADAI